MYVLELLDSEMEIQTGDASSRLNAPAGDSSSTLEEPGLYINRELSWLQFDWRVLEEARDEGHPLLERVKFLAITANNLDEFFMVRVSGLRQQLGARVIETSADKMMPQEQLNAIRREVLKMHDRMGSLWTETLLPLLEEAGIVIRRYHHLYTEQQSWVRRYFQTEIFPVLTPLAFDPAHPFPHISNLSLNLAVVINDPDHGERFARVKVPDSLPRLLALPAGHDEVANNGTIHTTDLYGQWIWLEDVVAANLDLLFPGLDVVAAYPFRVTRDADLEIEEDDAEDLLESVEEGVEQRHFGSSVRLEIDREMPDRIRDMLAKQLSLEPYQVYQVQSPVGKAHLMQLMKLERPDLKDPGFVPVVPSDLVEPSGVFDAIAQKDILLYHPYESFTPVVDFVREAARDPEVLAIKLTLYRVGTKSPIVDALMEARENGKQVAVLVELKARFDEENNIAWARALEQAGVHVVYGVVGLKTHAKMCLVVRRENNGIRRYVHMSTGNYNTVTSRIYSDLGFFTADEEIGAEMSDLFNALTGYSRKEEYRELLIAPGSLRRGIISRIHREIERQREHGDGRLAFKLNALVDKRCIKALYQASQAGVKVSLQVRGICCLRPGVPGISENITVTSIVGRFLEHARLYYFRNGGDEEILLGSADLMPRNLDRRIEILFPLNDPVLKRRAIDDILMVHLRDTVKARALLADGSYVRVQPDPGEEPLNSQLWMLDHYRQTGETPEPDVRT